MAPGAPPGPGGRPKAVHGGFVETNIYHCTGPDPPDPPKSAGNGHNWRPPKTAQRSRRKLKIQNTVQKSARSHSGPSLLPTRAKRSKSGSFGDGPTSTCPSESANSDFDVPKNRRAPPGPGGPPPGPLIFGANGTAGRAPSFQRCFGAKFGQKSPENRPKNQNSELPMNR